MSPNPHSPVALVAAAERLVRGRAVRALGAAGVALIPLVLVLAWAGAARWGRPSPWPLVLELLAIAGGVALFAAWRTRVRPRLDERAVATAAEQRLGLPRGALGGVLELRRSLPPGTSPALARRAEDSLVPALAGHPVAELSGVLGERWRRRERTMFVALLGTVAGAVLLGLASPERTRAGWAPLLHPVRHLVPPPLPPLVVKPGDQEVARGASVDVRILAPGREVVVLKWRLAGDVLHELTLPVGGDSARGEVAHVDADGQYWVEAPDGAVSDRFRLRAVDALLLSELSVEVVFPDYLGMPSEHYRGEPPPLELPAGTTLRVQGRATRGLRSVALHGADELHSFRVRGAGFEGSWTPTRSGVYLWSLRSDRGTPADVTPAPLEIVLRADLPPTVEITFPAADTIAPADLRQLLAADARDDHGLGEATLVSWRVRSDGVREPDVAMPIAVEGADRALLSAVLDLSARGLLPGDTLNYFIRVRDRSPGAQTGVSATYALRLPSAAELRRLAREQARAAVTRAESAAATAAEMTARSRDAQRRASAANARRGQRDASGGAGGEQESARMEYAETEAARALLQDQEQLLEQVAQLRESMAEVERTSAEAGLQDRALQEQLAALRELMDELLTPELRRQMQELQQSLGELDPDRMQEALERLSRQQQNLQQQLEQQLEMLRRAAAEQELGALAQQARELATQQEALAEAHREEPPAGTDADTRAESQRGLAEQGEQLAEEMEALRDQLTAQRDSASAAQTAAAGQRARAAESAMKQASGSAEQQRSEDAARQGRQAAAQLGQAAETLEQTQRSMGEAGRDEARGAMEQATRDALELAERQRELQQRMERSESGSDPQGMRPEVPRPGTPQPGAQEQGGQSGAQPTPAGTQPSGAEPGRQGGQRPGQQSGGQSPGASPGSGSGAGQSGGEGTPGARPSTAELGQMRAEQGALRQGLDQLDANVQQSAERSGMVSREVAAALGRSALSMQQTQQGLEQAAQSGRLPTEQAAQSVESLNRLALALLNNARQLEPSQAQGGGGQQAQQQLADLAQAQASLNGQASSLLPLGLSESAMADQARRLGREQQQLAQQLGGMNDLPGGREDVLGQLDLLARAADALARELQGGRIPPEVIARQERLFHRLLDAGRSLEREETGDEREAERPGRVTPAEVPPLDPALLRAATRFDAPTPDELRALPPAYRRLILEYFERLNRPLPPAPEAPPQ